MKETGMTRRVDELGRVVIPKEIRQIFKIKVGTPLEIFIEGDRLVMQKYSVAQGYLAFLNGVAESLASATGYTVAILSNESVVCAKGRDAAAFANIRVSDGLFKMLDSRQPFSCDAQDYFNLIERQAYVFPLVNNGDLLGAIVMVSSDGIDDSDKKLARLASDLFLKQLDD